MNIATCSGVSSLAQDVDLSMTAQTRDTCTPNSQKITANSNSSYGRVGLLAMNKLTANMNPNRR